MKISLCLLFIGISSLNLSQDYAYFYTDYNNSDPFHFYLDYYVKSEQNKDSLYKVNGVKEVKMYTENSKNSKSLYSIRYNDTSGKLLNTITDVNGKRSNHTFSNQLNNVSIYNWNRYGKSSSYKINEYEIVNGKQRIKTTYSFYKNRLSYRQENFWNSFGKTDSVLYFHRGEDVPYSKSIRVYEDGKLIESRYYKKGELKQIQKYDCNPIDEPIKKVTQTATCVNTDFDKDGNRIETIEYTNSQGEAYKKLITYEGDSKKMTKREDYNSDNVLRYYFEIKNSIETRIYFNKKGKQRAKQVTFYENGKVIKIEKYNKKNILFYSKTDNDSQIVILRFRAKNGKLNSKSVSKLNEKQQVVTKEYWKNNKLNWKMNYEYNEKGLLSKSVSTNSKGQKHIYYTEYKYFD